MENYTEKIRHLVQSMDSENIQLAIVLAIDTLGWSTERLLNLIFSEKILVEKTKTIGRIQHIKIFGVENTLILYTQRRPRIKYLKFTNEDALLRAILVYQNVNH